MIKGKAVYFFLGIIIIIALFLRLFSYLGIGKKSNNIGPQTVSVVSEDEKTQKFILEGNLATSTASSSASSSPVIKEAIVESPQANDTISSPLVIKGEAPGYWFFEASLPIKLLDNQGVLIASAPASAESDPLTDNLVPFKALLEFNTTATSGYLVVNNDNPSGLPENELSVKIPELFLNK